MSLLDEYQNLLKDTLSSLKNCDEKYTETNSDFFISDLENFINRKKSNHNPSYEKKKYNVNVNPSDITIDIEKKEIKKDLDLPPKQIASPPLAAPSSTETKSNIDEKKQDYKEAKIVATPPTKTPINTPVSEPIVKKENINPINETKKPIDKKVLDDKKIVRDEKPKIFDDSFLDIKKSIEKIFPNISILKEPIDDKVAKQKSQKYKLKNISSTITILAYKEDEKLYRFLEKLSIALGVYFYPTKVVSAYLIEKENSWDDFLTSDISLIIASDYTIFELPHLRKFYKENPSKGEKILKDIDLFLLPDLFLYLKEPSLKKSLFNALKQKISNIKNDK